MPSADEYRRRIQQCGWTELETLWEGIKNGTTSDSHWAAGKALEYVVVRAFESDTAEVRWPYSVREQGQEIEQIDDVVYTEGLACLLECKDYDDAVTIEPVAKLRNQLLRRPASTIGVIVSRNGFTEPAVILARYVTPQAIILWDGDDLDRAINRKSIRTYLVRKYRYLVEYSLPNYSIAVEDIP